MGLQEKQQAVEGAAQAALEASSAAEAQHAAGAKQLAADKRSLQEQQDQVGHSLVPTPPCLPVFLTMLHSIAPTLHMLSAHAVLMLTAQKHTIWWVLFVLEMRKLVLFFPLHEWNQSVPAFAGKGLVQVNTQQCSVVMVQQTPSVLCRLSRSCSVLQARGVK